MIDWKPPENAAGTIRDFPPPPLSPLQVKNQEFIKSDPHLHKAFKKMQASAKERNAYQSLCYAAEVIENLTGHLGLESWIVGNFDEDF